MHYSYEAKESPFQLSCIKIGCKHTVRKLILIVSALNPNPRGHTKKVKEKTLKIQI